MTSLIDVIFLLLLFFMLSTSFSHFAETPLSAAKAGTGVATEPPRFLQISPHALVLNGQSVTLESLPDVLARPDRPLLVALRPGVTAQRLSDVLDQLQQVDGLDVTVIE